jgi:hypothetical protein
MFQELVVCSPNAWLPRIHEQVFICETRARRTRHNGGTGGADNERPTGSKPDGVDILSIRAQTRAQASKEQCECACGVDARR